jgi:hypothetical protein
MSIKTTQPSLIVGTTGMHVTHGERVGYSVLQGITYGIRVGLAVLRLSWKQSQSASWIGLSTKVL